MRRLPFQQKIGAGLTMKQFQRGVEDDTLRHVGFTESINMIGDALGWKLDRVIDDIVLKTADTAVASELLAVDPGYVCGIVQDGVGYVKGEPRITLHLEAYLGATVAYDSVLIEGVPRIYSKVEGGVHGDIATASMAVINSIPAVNAAAPGLRSMRDVRLPSFYPAPELRSEWRRRSRQRLLLSACSQFTTTVMGGAAPSSMTALSRNRPSLATAY